MKLSEYETAVAALERGEVSDSIVAALEGRYPGSVSRAEAVAEAADWLAREIRGCAWQTWARAEAAALAARCDALARQGVAQ